MVLGCEWGQWLFAGRRPSSLMRCGHGVLTAYEWYIGEARSRPVDVIEGEGCTRVDVFKLD